MRCLSALGKVLAVAVLSACAQDENAAGVPPAVPVEFSAWERYAGLLLLLLALAAFAAIYVKFKHLWEKRASRAAALFAAGHEQQDMGAALLSFLCPSIAVNRYTFKGMEPRSDRVSLSFNELGLELRDGRKVLEGVTGHFEAGKLVAIMGPSGVGKTTFLNVLSGRATYGKQTGKVRVNGKRCDLHSLQSVTGFVPQDDIVHERFTVRENLWYSAQLRQEAGTPAHILDDIVVDVLNVLQIGHIQMSIVGGVEQRCISGGERKRVNIGLELAASPTLLFMDEPTSGLDSSSALMLINSMKKMTQLGMSIIMVIHQPRYSIFTLFDSVLLLGRGGRAAFLGSSLQTMPYFSSLGFELPPHANPAEWFMDILTGQCKPLSAGVAVSDLPRFWIKTGAESVAQNPVDVTLQREGIATACARKELQERWSSMGMDQSSGISSSELKVLLTRCMGEEPRDAAFSLMCDRLFEGQARASQEELLDFMVRDVMRRPSQILEDAIGVRLSSSSSLSSKFSSWSSHGPTNSRGLRREIPGPLAQYVVICHRKCVEVFRNSFRRAMDISLLLVIALIMGVKHQDDPGNPHNMFLAMLGLSLCMTVSSLKLFGADRAMLERESSHGLSRAAYCLGGMTVDSVDVMLQCMMFTCTYYLALSPPMPSRYYMRVFMMLALVVSGWGYVVSIVTPHQSATMAGVVLCFIQSGVLGHPDYVVGFIDGGLLECMVALSPTRWSLQMLLLEWFEVLKVAPPGWALKYIVAFRSSMGDQRQAIKDKDPGDALLIPQEEQNHWWSAFWALACTAALLRVLAVLLLCYCHRLVLLRRTLYSRLWELGRSAPQKEAPAVMLSRAATGCGASLATETSHAVPPRDQPVAAWEP